MTEIRKITLHFPSLRAFLAAYGERISPEGMLLRGEAPPAAGSLVDIEVVVAEGMRLVRARGETLWSGAAGAGGRKAAAVRFRELDEASRTLIGKIVDQRRRQGAEPFNLEAATGPRQARPRDLTVPAAPVPGVEGSAEGAGDSIFDLDEPSGEPAVDLISAVGVGRSAPEAEAPAGGRQSAPPVPLLAEPDPGPIDLGLEGAAGEDDEVAAAGLELETPASGGGPAVSQQADLSELFGGDEPQSAPKRGRTEAFPPSFVDEVEAELEAAGTTEATDGSYSLVDTGELEMRLGSPIEEPEADDDAAEVVMVMPEAPPEASPESESVVEAEVVGDSEPEPPAMEADPPIAGDAVSAAAVPPESEPQAAAEAEAESRVGEAMPEPDPEPMPEPDSEPELESDSESGAEAAAPETPPEVARAFAAQRGPETIEIPIPEVQPVELPSPGQTEESAVPAAPALDDNLLSIPELQKTAADGEDTAGDEGPGEAEEFTSSAESLRGAASRSRHVGTWLLIALLIGALSVAGFFLAGMMGGEEAAPEPGADATGPASRAAIPDSGTGAEAPADAASDEEAESDAAEGATVEPVATGNDTATASPAPVEPAAPLTGLNRITWNETDAETILALVGDGAIPREQIEVATLAGDQPRLVIKITGVERAFQPAALEVGTSHVQRVRTGLQPGGELHVVVDLTGPGISMRELKGRGSRLEVRIGAE